MNAQNFGEHIKFPNNVSQSNPAVNSPRLTLDPLAEKHPLVTDILQVMPMSASAEVVAPLDDPIVRETPLAETVNHVAPSGTNPGSPAPLPLLDRGESEQLRARWNEIQGKFVDEPRAAVQQADELVAEVVQKVIKMFASEHSSLEGQWNQGMDVSTEDLRKALQHYRSFFNRLVV
jgi:hypothetical protein